MEWHGIADLYHPREYGMIPTMTLQMLNINYSFYLMRYNDAVAYLKHSNLYSHESCHVDTENPIVFGRPFTLPVLSGI